MSKTKKFNRKPLSEPGPAKDRRIQNRSKRAKAKQKLRENKTDDVALELQNNKPHNYYW
jgi:hypothetical protein